MEGRMDNKKVGGREERRENAEGRRRGGKGGGTRERMKEGAKMKRKGRAKKEEQGR